MFTASALAETKPSTSTETPLPKKAVARPLRVQAFSHGNQDEVLAFLAERPIHTVFMSGLIRDNGLISFANRGTFYGCRDTENKLTGVALIGPKTVIESRDAAALSCFANLVPNNLTSHLVRGEHQQMEFVLARYAEAGRQPRHISSELLLEQTAPAAGVQSEPNLRLAYAEDLDAVISINADLAFEESGTNPLSQDARGMWARTARRVDQGRVWIMVEDGRLIFKADVISETPETVFIEGVYVQPDARRRHYGTRCMTQLARNLLGRFGSLCLVVNDENARARSFYQKLGYQIRSSYSTAYFSAT